MNKRYFYLFILLISLKSVAQETLYDLTAVRPIIGSRPNIPNINSRMDPLINHMQDFKKSIGMLFINDTKYQVTLMNTVAQQKDKVIMLLSYGENDPLLNININENFVAYFSPHYELSSASDPGDNLSVFITNMSPANLVVRFKDNIHRLLLLELSRENNPENFNDLNENIYLTGWDYSRNTNETIGKIGFHPRLDHKKKMFTINNNVDIQDDYTPTRLDNLLVFDYIESNNIGFFNRYNSGLFYKIYLDDAIWNITTNQLNDGAAYFDNKGYFKGLVLFRDFQGLNHLNFLPYHKSIYALTNFVNRLDTSMLNILDENDTWVSKMPGGYFNDLYPVDPNNLNLTMTNDFYETPGIDKNNPTELEEDVIYVRPTEIFRDMGKIQNPTNIHVEFPKIGPFLFNNPGIDYIELDECSVVLTLWYLDKDENSGIYTERLIYGGYVSPSTDKSYEDGFFNTSFKSYGWDCTNPQPFFPPCKRLGRVKNSDDIKAASLRAATEYHGDEYFMHIMLAAIGENSLDNFTKTKTPVVIRLYKINCMGNPVIKAINVPGEMPFNTVQLFQSDAFFNSNETQFYDAIQSNKYPDSRGMNSNNLHINNIIITQNNYTNTISSGNTGGYLNLVNPNYKLGPAVTSTEEVNKSLSIKVNLHNPYNNNYKYGAWIDYFNTDELNGIDPLLKTYNFVEEYAGIVHDEELLIQSSGSGNSFSIEEVMPMASDISLAEGDKRKTRLRISVKINDGTDIEPYENFQNGVVHDYLIEIAAPTDSELEEIELEKVFDKISMADGSSENAGISPPQGESGNRLGSGNDDASINNDLAFLYNDNTNQNLEMADFLVDFGDAINAVQVGVNAILFDGVAKIMVGGATGGGSDGDFIYGPYSKHTSTYDLIPDLICEDLNGDGQCDNRRLTNSNTAYQIVYEEGGGENGLSLRFNGTNIQYGVRINNRLEVIDYSYDLVPNQYTNFTIGFNEGEMELYINGSKVATNNNFATTGISTIPQHLDPAGLAGIAGTGTIWEDDSENVNFHGMIDYFGYTNNTLTEAQITNLTTPTNNNNARQIKNNHSKKVKQNIATKEPHLSIFPNPVKDELNILLEVQQAGSLNLSLFDLNGKQVYEMRRRKINQGHQLITLKNLKIKAGQYLLEVKVGNSIKTHKVLFKQ